MCLARKQDSVTRPDGTEVTLRVFRCRKCGQLFNDDDWQLRCQAPPPRGTIAAHLDKPRKAEEIFPADVIERLDQAGAEIDVANAPDRIEAIAEMLRRMRGE